MKNTKFSQIWPRIFEECTEYMCQLKIGSYIPEDSGQMLKTTINEIQMRIFYSLRTTNICKSCLQKSPLGYRLASLLQNWLVNIRPKLTDSWRSKKKYCLYQYRLLEGTLFPSIHVHVYWALLQTFFPFFFWLRKCNPFFWCILCWGNFSTIILFGISVPSLASSTFTIKFLFHAWKINFL